MGAPGSAAPGATTDAEESADTVGQMDAMDQMDDDGSPEPEEIHAAAEHAEQAAGAQSRHGEPRAESSEPQSEPRVEATPVAPVEPALAPPATPDHADPDPQ